MIFFVSHGLRGCYEASGSYVAKFASRRELKAAVQDEANAYRDSGHTGASKAAVAAFVAEAWRMAKAGKLDGLPLALPLTPRGSDHAAFGVFLSRATRADLNEYRANEDI